jgi:hypothetical protein
MIIERTIRGFKVTMEQISNIPSVIDEHIKEPILDFFNYALWTPDTVQFISHLLENVIAFCSMII